MKTFITTLFLTIGMVGFINGQTASQNKSEKFKLFHKEKKVEVRKQVNHFEDLKVDKEKAEHNSTQAFHKMKPKKYNVNGNGFAAPKLYAAAGNKKSLSSTGRKKHTLHKTKNKTFQTYVMK